MRVPPAEIIRTLMAGHRHAYAHIAWEQGVFTVPTALDQHNAPILLVPTHGRLAAALASENGEDTAVALRYDDEPPLDNAPDWGSAWVCGWASVLEGVDATAAAVDFATVAPLPQLLDVGDEYRLWRVAVGQAGLERAGTVDDVPLEDYSAAEPDPWYEMETELLHDLYAQHPEVLRDLTHRVSHVVTDISWVAPLRINRHGVVLDVHTHHDTARRFFLPHRHDVAGHWRPLDSPR